MNHIPIEELEKHTVKARETVERKIEGEALSEYTLYQGDCLDVMAGMEAGSIDSVITDPPLRFGFHGQRVGSWRTRRPVLG